jgi:thymidylate kinase
MSEQAGQVPCWVIALTGGPCAGKTTALGRLQAHFQAAGLRVYIVPEAATLLWSSGCAPADLTSGEPRIAFQSALLKLQLQLEESLAAIARANGTPAIVLCDRGTMDGKAYMSDAEWSEVLVRNALTEETCQHRYDCVLHLITAADGAVMHYAAHALRRETSDEAVTVDRRTTMVWSQHPRRHTFDNSTDMEGKLARVLRAVAEVIQEPPGMARRLAAEIDIMR